MPIVRTAALNVLAGNRETAFSHTLILACTLAPLKEGFLFANAFSNTNAVFSRNFLIIAAEAIR
jgi:hypothetical protein